MPKTDVIQRRVITSSLEKMVWCKWKPQFLLVSIVEVDVGHGRIVAIIVIIPAYISCPYQTFQ